SERDKESSCCASHGDQRVWHWTGGPPRNPNLGADARFRKSLAIITKATSVAGAGRALLRVFIRPAQPVSRQCLYCTTTYCPHPPSASSPLFRYHQSLPPLQQP